MSKGFSGEPDERGSMWHRWDPHIHAPGTAMEDHFGKSETVLDDYIKAIEAVTPKIEALGVTDYFSTKCYEDVLAKKMSGRLPGVQLLFPNVELRLSIPTKDNKGVNVHLLVSPEDPNHIEEINRFLSLIKFRFDDDTFSCSRDDLIRLGKRHDSSIKDDDAAYSHGIGQFKFEFEDLKNLIQQNNWMRSNCLVAFAANSKDGTSGVRTEAGQFDAMRKEMESFAQIIFTANPGTIDFWLGRKGVSIEELEKKYNGPKPSLHGCDAHDFATIGNPDQQRYCWIKGDLTFDALRQACIEPELRTYIGEALPVTRVGVDNIRYVSTQNAPWFLDDGIVVNPGLVAVIRARGSGKTAFADLLALTGKSDEPLNNEKSFIRRARAHCSSVVGAIDWTSGERFERSLLDQVQDGIEPSVHYLSQQFVEHLCSGERIADDLIQEIQAVVFHAQPEEQRMDASSFRELLEEKTADSLYGRQYAQLRLDDIAENIFNERSKKDALRELRQRKIDLDKKLKTATDDRKAIVGKGEKSQEGRSSYYERLRVAIDRRTRVIQALGKRDSVLQRLSNEIDRHTRSVLPDITRALKNAHADSGLTEGDWQSFELRFVGDVKGTVAASHAEVEKQKEIAIKGTSASRPTIESTPEELAMMSLQMLRDESEKVSKEIGIDERNAATLKKLNSSVASWEAEQKGIERSIKDGEEAESRLTSLYGERVQMYKDFFESLIAEESQLSSLYKPLEEILSSDSNDSLNRLRLVVIRNVDVESWAERGEGLLDLRKNGAFKGRGALAQKANELLRGAWETGMAGDVSQAMSEFRGAFDGELITHCPHEPHSQEARRWSIEIGRWLYSTDHIEVTYSFQFDGLPLAQLSPGTRGLVLLLLYLALDQSDERPLVIDQPEENLDPRSVFAELVPLFKKARPRRQVIVITHNANLVVNTDVDQVIVAKCDRGNPEEPPSFSYVSGSLENAAIRREVCEILEGGEEAFRQRAKRLRIGFPKERAKEDIVDVREVRVK